MEAKCISFVVSEKQGRSSPTVRTSGMKGGAVRQRSGEDEQAAADKMGVRLLDGR